jgi:3-deoxy-D-manno-octulosonic-acid transferase
MILSIYRTLTTLAGPLISHYLKKRLARGKEHPGRFGERLGDASIKRPDGKLVWLHGASVGEAISLLPLIGAIQEKYGNYTILVTTGTVTSAALLEKRLPEGVIHQFSPVDRLPYVRKFLDHWRPDIAIWAESELWPNLLCETRKRPCQMALINARMSDRSLRKWGRFKGFISTLLGTFDLCLAQTERDGQRFKALGAKHVFCHGNLKYASPDLPADVDELNKLKDIIGNRPIWLAASTHKGEEALIGRVHKTLRTEFDSMLSVIVPRHPERGDEIAQELCAQGLKVAVRSQSDLLTAQTDVYLADTLGEMGLFYRLVSIVFIGKSMEPLGGQNPLEPARLDCAMICGPYMTNFIEIMQCFEEQQAICIIEDEGALAAKVAQLLRDPDQMKDLAQKAKTVAYAQASVLDKTMEALSGLFTPVGPKQ